MSYPILAILGASMIGYILPEILVAISQNKIRVPYSMNIVSGIGVGLFAAGCFL
jgi:hypothetical protein